MPRKALKTFHDDIVVNVKVRYFVENVLLFAFLFGVFVFNLSCPKCFEIVKK